MAPYSMNSMTDVMNLNFDPMWLFLSLIPSGVGFVLFIYGKNRAACRTSSRGWC